MTGETSTRITSAGKSHACPACGSRDVARIIYGMPAWDATWEANMAAGEWAIGGCVIRSMAPSMTCNVCKTSFSPTMSTDGEADPAI